jgi:hypothetical protein
MELVVEISFIRDILIDIYPNVCIFICLLGLYGDTFFFKKGSFINFKNVTSR